MAHEPRTKGEANNAASKKLKKRVASSAKRRSSLAFGRCAIDGQEKMTNSVHLDALASRLINTFSESIACRPDTLDLLVLGDHWKDTELIRDLEEEHISSLSDAWISEHSDYLPCLSSAGLRVMLPQFAIYSARNIDTDVTDSLIAALARLSESSKLGLELRNLLSQDEKSGYAQYLRSIKCHYPMTRVMKPYFDEALANWPMPD